MIDTAIVDLVEFRRRGIVPGWRKLPVMRDRWLCMESLRRAAHAKGWRFHLNFVVGAHR